MRKSHGWSQAMVSALYPAHLLRRFLCLKPEDEVVSRGGDCQWAEKLSEMPGRRKIENKAIVL